MSIIWPAEGRKLACERITGRRDNGYNGNAGRLCLRLFTNNFTPDANSEFEDFTEATFSGYARISLPTSLWSVAASNGSGQAYTVLLPQWFRHSGGVTSNTAYGWYLTTDPSLGEDRILCCERFDTSKSFATSSDELPVGIQINTGNLDTGVTIPNEGKPRILDRLFGKVNARQNLALRLFKNAVTLAGTLTLADFTVANFSGYADASIAYDGWETAVANVSGRGQITQAALTQWTHSGGDISNSVYGYCVHESGLALWCERFADVKAISATNPYLFLQARFELGAA